MDIDEQTAVFNDWIDTHRGLFFKVVHSYARNRHDQEDLMQEILIQVWKSIPGYRGQSAVSTWIYRVGLYTAIAWSKRDTKQRIRASEFDADQHLIRVTEQLPDPRLEWIYDKINDLDEIDRSIALMWLDDQPYQEIATALGISNSNVGVKLNRIKRKLTEALQKQTDK